MRYVIDFTRPNGTSWSVVRGDITAALLEVVEGFKGPEARPIRITITERGDKVFDWNAAEGCKVVAA